MRDLRTRSYSFLARIRKQKKLRQSVSYCHPVNTTRLLWGDLTIFFFERSDYMLWNVLTKEPSDRTQLQVHAPGNVAAECTKSHSEFWHLARVSCHDKTVYLVPVSQFKGMYILLVQNMISIHEPGRDEAAFCHASVQL